MVQLRPARLAAGKHSIWAARRVCLASESEAALEAIARPLPMLQQTYLILPFPAEKDIVSHFKAIDASIQSETRVRGLASDGHVGTQPVPAV